VRLSLDRSGFRYRPGQAAWLGIAGRPELVPYSIASAPGESDSGGHLEFLLKIEPDGWGPHLEGLRRGTRVTVRGPFGSFVFPTNPEERNFLFVAGGTGVAPLRSMVRHALLTNQPGRLHFLYSARTPLDFAYAPELRRYAREGRLQLALTATREAPPGWRAGRGRITPARLMPLIDTPETLCFVCGPAAMVDEVPRMLRERGVDPKRIRLEEW